MHHELHRSHHTSWLRAAVLGANDGLISTSSIVVGVAAANSPRETILLAGVAGLVAGSLAMAAGEYVSVSSQSDTEQADLKREMDELATKPESELAELTGIYISRGLTPELAHQVAVQLTAHDALGTHLREELGYSEITQARPLQAALASAAAFFAGASPTLLLVWFLPVASLSNAVFAGSIALLMLLGALAARTGGAPILPGITRVTFWGLIAMASTAFIGRLFGTSVS